MSNLDKELETALKEKIGEKISNDEDLINLILLYISKQNSSSKKAELTEILEKIYKKTNND